MDQQLKMIMSPGEFLAQTMCFIQSCYPVRTFPPPGSRLWGKWVHEMADDRELKNFLPRRPFGVGGTVASVANIDPDTNLTSVDVEKETSLGGRYPDQAQRAYELALTIADGKERFIQFC